MARLIELGGRKIGFSEPCFIVAEISCNHMQDKELALNLIDEAKKSDADAVKFQAYLPETLTLNPAEMNNSERKNFEINDTIWQGRSLYDLYSEAYTPWEWFPDLKDKAESCGLFFFVSPFDESSLDYLENIGVEAYKIASFEINHIPLIKKVAATGKPIIFSTGVAEKNDITLAMDTIRSTGNNNTIILKCTSSYPAPIDEANLSTIPDIAQTFDSIVGLSDHTIDPNIPAYAVALGARLVEKHFTLEKKGPDAEFSLLPEEFAEMVRNIRRCERAMGKPNYQLTEKVKNHRFLMRSIFAAKYIKKGERFTDENIKIVRPAYGLPPKYYEDIIGKIATKDIYYGQALNHDMVDYD